MQLDYFDGFPYLVTEVAPLVYNLTLLPAELSLDEMVGIVRWQATTNKLSQCLVLQHNLCLYCDPDGSETCSTQIPSGGIQLGDYLYLCCRFRATAELRGRWARLGQWLEVRGWDGNNRGDPNRGGRPATAEEIETLSGDDANGIPKGLSRCQTCGEFRGECLSDFGADVLLVPVTCRCENDTRCARCAEPLAWGRLNANVLQHGRIVHVPGFAAFRHECREDGRQERVDLGLSAPLEQGLIPTPRAV